jgi:hypothetical protein
MRRALHDAALLGLLICLATAIAWAWLASDIAGLPR